VTVVGFQEPVRNARLWPAEQCSWWHKVAKVPDVPKSAHPTAKLALAEIYNAEDQMKACDPHHLINTPSPARSPMLICEDAL
jgi:hypothetical protein